MADRWMVDCWNCGDEGEIEGDCTCGEDTCCCLEPEPPSCSHCHGCGFLIVSQLTDDNCDGHFPVGADGEFTWDGSTEKVGT